MTTASALRDALYHSWRQAGDAIQERAPGARRWPHLLGPCAQPGRPGHEDRRDRSGAGVPLLAVQGLRQAESHHEPC
jgi:hypothetical protein